MKNIKYFCHDCKCKLEKGERYMPYEVNGETFIKCVACHKLDPILRNFRETEVYSRIVGYIRPLKQWNPVKKQEFKDRKVFRVKK